MKVSRQSVSYILSHMGSYQRSGDHLDQYFTTDQGGLRPKAIAIGRLLDRLNGFDALAIDNIGFRRLDSLGSLPRRFNRVVRIDDAFAPDAP
jgi:hypothetical protein